MRAFRCQVCEAPLFFENSICISCGTSLGYSRAEQAIVPVDDQGRYVDPDGLVWWVCRNLNESGCTWLASLQGGVCVACELTRNRPAVATPEFREAEAAKRHLVYELDRLGLPVRTRAEDATDGLAFDLLQSDGGPGEVVIGHNEGIITIDLAESDDAYREKVRATLAEPYRTMLGHFRHEIGHYYEWQLVRGPDLMAECTRLFGDENADYEAAIARHYDEGAPADWRERYISTYATMHPFEDFAETWAHYLHIRDALETAIAYGFTARADLADDHAFRGLVVDTWIPLSTALNVLNRSMGRDDLYPFVIPAPVLDKLEYVAGLAPR